MNPYQTIDQMKKSSVRKELEIKALKKEVKELKKENRWLQTRVEKLLHQAKRLLKVPRPLTPFEDILP